MKTKEHTNVCTKHVYQRSFHEFLREAEELIKQGYSFDFVDNLRFPTAGFSEYQAIMVLNEESDKDSQVNPKEPETNKAGRKKKVD